MLISEIYRSRQGEGLLTGTPSVFVRTSGCNLRCGFCDTPFASWAPEGETLSISQIVNRVQSSAEDAKHVVLTGGEPMLPREVVDLCTELRRDRFHITIETAGTIDRDVDCDLMSISPKFSNSDPEVSRAGEWLQKHQRTRNRPGIVQQMIERYEYQLKFVVDTAEDVDEIQAYTDALANVDKNRILLMPQGITQEELETKAKWLVPICAERGFQFCPRKHIEWYGNERGT